MPTATGQGAQPQDGDTSTEVGSTVPVPASVMQQPCIGLLSDGSTAYIVDIVCEGVEDDEDDVDENVEGDGPDEPFNGELNTASGPSQGGSGKPEVPSGNGPPTVHPSRGQGAEHSNRP